jgi:hypothetical protein
MVKEELNSEEKFFENAVKAEHFVKRYKKMLIGGVVVLVLGVGAKIAYDINVRSSIEKANAALSALQKDSNNKEAQTQLKQLNPDLFDAWKLSVALRDADNKALSSLTNSKAIAVGDVAQYQSAVNTKDIKALQEYSMKPQAIYKDLALFELAVLLLRENKVDEAHAKLKAIAKESPIYRYSQPLMHYGVK